MMSISSEYIPRINLPFHIIQTSIIPVGNDGMALALESIQVIHHLAAEERAAIFDIEPGSSNCQKLRLVRPGQEDICSEYSESPWFYEVAEIAMILALKDYDACYAALKKTRQVVTVLEAAREDAQLGF